MENKLFKNWIVMSNNKNEHFYFYGTLSDYEEEDLSGLKVISEDKYTADDVAVLFGNILEDKNKHSITSIGEDILKSIRSVVSLTDKEEVEILKNFMKQFLKI